MKGEFMAISNRPEVQCYFVLNFDQASDFADRYQLLERRGYKNVGWYRTILYYTSIYALPDAFGWRCSEARRDEIVERYGLELAKKNGDGEYWIFKRE